MSIRSDEQSTDSEVPKTISSFVTDIDGKVATIDTKSERKTITVVAPDIRATVERDVEVPSASQQPIVSRTVPTRKRRAPLLIEMPSESPTETRQPETKRVAAAPVEPISPPPIVEETRAVVQRAPASVQRTPESIQRAPTSVPRAPARVPVGDPVLAQQAVPSISTQVTGPEEIVLGRKAIYRLAVRNNGNISASNVIAEISIPTSADLVSSEATDGLATRRQGRVEWQIQELAAGGSAELTIALVPRSSEQLALGTAVRFAPIAHQAIVVVQEPRLEISLKGPDDVLFGQPQIYQLRVSNPGTGTAENVVLHLLPPGADESERNSHPIGSLVAGKSETFDVELVAHNAGSLNILASAMADGDIVSKCEKNVFVRQPKLAIDSRGPEESYAGTVATYIFRVRNDGTADAEEVSVKVKLPARATLVDASKGGQTDADGRTVHWKIAKVAAGENATLEMRCEVHQPGSNQVAATAATPDDALFVQDTLSTHVVALADLKLEVSDPTGPIAVGNEAVYEIRVRNRGAATAEAIQIVALFSTGIDPVNVEGSQHTMNNGRVAFSPIKSLAPGAEETITIRAVASKAGTHIFRAEVLCKELETKLTMEETTRYYDAGFGRTTQTSTANRDTGPERK